MSVEERKSAASDHEEAADLPRVATIDVDNYHGIKAKTLLVYLSVNLIAAAQILNLVGAAAYARDLAADLGGATETVWLSQSIAILTCVLGPPMSQAADYWGRKWLIVVPTLVGFAGSMIVARARSMGMAIAGEVICGVAYGSQPLLYAVASEILPRRFRPAAQAGINLFISLAGVFSILVGSVLVQRSVQGYRTFWYITAGALGVSGILCLFFYNPPPRPLQKTLTTTQKLRKLDWIGILLLASGIVLFSMALSWSQNPYGWTDAHIIAPFSIGVLLLVGLGVHQGFIKKDGMIHHDLFQKDRNFAISLICIFVEGMVFFATNNFLPFEVSVLYETDAVRIGLHFAVAFFTVIVCSFGLTAFFLFTKELRAPLVASFVSFTIFNGVYKYLGTLPSGALELNREPALMATATLSSSTAVWAYPIFVGFGLGVCLTCLVAAAQLSAPPALIAISSGLMISMRSLGGSVSLAIYNAIFNAQIEKNLGPSIASSVLPLGLSTQVLPDFIGALVSGDRSALLSLPNVTPEIIEAGILGLKEAYLSSFRYVWVCAAVFSFVGAVGKVTRQFFPVNKCSDFASATCFTINPAKDLTMHVDAPLDDES
ncbi:hypothetical protein LTR84_011950 [Exophiala bonariae]|uniref:Major facilitator superfamily (MFS) profile domain-containing protein n=1 Tax=Exophiala bonariae TaxID=1690606 RepID=A0AAV9MS30_9EURO|nr:hypothetical protein LTR84_011950 [Exophiala bonariae]